MSTIISLGKFNHYYKYILLSSLFLFLNLMAFGINYNYSFAEIKLFPTQRQLYFSRHKYIHYIFCYFFTFLLGMVYYFNEKHKIERNSIVSNKTENKRTESSSFIKLIHKDIGKLYFSINSFLNLLFTIFLWVIMDFFMDFYTHTLKDLDFWFFELLILSYISNKMLKFKLYSHQKLAIYFNSALCITKMIAIILSFIDAKNKENTKNDKYLWYTLEYPVAKIIFGIMIYFALITIRSYVNFKIKAYMDLKYISAKLLLMLYGLFGTIIYIIICLITISVECTTSSIFSYNYTCSISNSFSFNNNCTQNCINNFVCKVPFNNTTENESISYLDNFSIYFKTFKNSNALEIFQEIIIILFAGITYFYYKYFCLMIIKYLSPIHYIFSNEIYFSFKKIALPIYTLFNEGSFFSKNPMNYIVYKYTLDTSGDFLSLIGFFVFLELIELNFCDFNINLRRKIMDRSEFESFDLLADNFDEDDDDNDNNDNNKGEELDNK